jgi:hypothetical protein
MIILHDTSQLLLMTKISLKKQHNSFHTHLRRFLGGLGSSCFKAISTIALKHLKTTIIPWPIQC